MEVVDESEQDEALPTPSTPPKQSDEPNESSDDDSDAEAEDPNENIHLAAAPHKDNSAGEDLFEEANDAIASISQAHEELTDFITKRGLADWCSKQKKVSYSEVYPFPLGEKNTAFESLKLGTLKELHSELSKFIFSIKDGKCSDIEQFWSKPEVL